MLEYHKNTKKLGIGGGIQMIFDYAGLKSYIESHGIKQKIISQKSGVPEVQLSLILQGKRKCEAGEYAGICKALGADPRKFMKPRLPDKEVK